MGAGGDEGEEMKDKAPIEVQVLLVGGRQTPNVIGVLTQRPSIVEFMVSKDEREETLHGLRAAISPIDGVTLADSSEPFDPFDFQLALEKCKQICDKYGGPHIYFNLTGSTKIMALAAYQAAKDYGASAFYVDTANCRILPVVGTVKQALLNLSIEQYLSAFGRIPKPSFDFQKLSFKQKVAEEVSCLLAENDQLVRDLLMLIRQSQGKGRRKIALESELLGMARRLVDLGAIDLQKDNLGIEIRTNEDWNFFTGGWLEVYAWSEAQKQTDKEGQPIFQDCKLSLKIPSDRAEKEIDVVALYQGQLILCSCKAETNPFHTHTLDELSAVANLIGGRYCSRIFVTNALLEQHKTKDEFLAQAKQREIVIVSGENLANIGEIIVKQALHPDYWRV